MKICSGLKEKEGKLMNLGEETYSLQSEDNLVGKISVSRCSSYSEGDREEGLRPRP